MKEAVKETIKRDCTDASKDPSIQISLLPSTE